MGFRVPLRPAPDGSEKKQRPPCAASIRAESPPTPMLLDRLQDLEKAPLSRAYTSQEYDLEGFRRWVNALGAPHRGQIFLHIAGTKGKGSTAALSEALLREHGFPTAMFTSPHLSHYGERFRYDGAPWTFEQFSARLEAFESALSPEQRASLQGDMPFRTVFEVLTALALVDFRRRGEELQAAGHPRPQIVVWETGLGGRLDCTNIVDPAASIITAIGLDHVKILGPTVERIAAEKAGIIKAGRPAVISRQVEKHDGLVQPIFLKRSAFVGAPLVQAGERYPVLEAEDAVSGHRVVLEMPEGGALRLDFALHGKHQTGNLQAALAGVELLLHSFGMKLVREAVQRAAAGVSWPGRLEILASLTGRHLLLDGAHCPLSAMALGDSIRQLSLTDLVLLIGMQGDKDVKGFVRALLEGLGAAPLAVVVHPVAGPRTARPADLAAALEELGLPLQQAESPEMALAAGLACDSKATLLATGSLYGLHPIKLRWKELFNA